jgi:SAM-dependent methyltransferase
MTPETFEKIYPEAKAGGFSQYDGTVAFYTRVNALLKETDVAVDLGAGRGAFFSDDTVPYRRSLQLLKGKCARITGLDVSEAVLTNPAVDESFVIGSDGKLPLGESSVDFILSDHTFEHIADAEQFEEEIFRVLKPGGWLCARTPNLFGYIALFSRLIPEQLHEFVLNRAQTHRKMHDVFPTPYKLNSRRQLNAVFLPERWSVICYNTESGPAYFGNNYYVNLCAEFVLRRMPNFFKSTIFIFAQKNK